jgi:hypothetical protein
MPSTHISTADAKPVALPVGHTSNRKRVAKANALKRRREIDAKLARIVPSNASDAPSSRDLRSNLRTPGVALLTNTLLPKAMSRIPKAWSDMYREPEYPSIEYAPEYQLGLIARGLRFNPAPWEVNASKVRYREYSEKLGSIITKTRTVYHGGMRQRPVPKLSWRGEPCLFDWCTLGDDRSRMPDGRRVVYHVPIGTLPPFPSVRACKPRTEELVALLADWKGRQQLAYLEALGVSL